MVGINNRSSVDTDLGHLVRKEFVDKEGERKKDS